MAVRKKEGLKERTGVIHGETPTDPVVIEENGGVKILVIFATVTRRVSIWINGITACRSEIH